MRDYIHVVDLATGHVAALKKLEQAPGLFICNLGTGHGYSVLDVIRAYSKACGKDIPYVIDPRRPGDIAECYADPSKALKELGWQAPYGIEDVYKRQFPSLTGRRAALRRISERRLSSRPQFWCR